MSRRFALPTTIVTACLAVIGLSAIATPANAATTIAAPVITSPSNGTVTNNSAPYVSGTGIPGDQVVLNTAPPNGAVMTSNSTTVASDGSWTIRDFSLVQAGSYTITAIQSDAAGDTSPASNAVTITLTSTPLLAAPVITSPADGTTTNNTSPVFSGTGTAGDTLTLTVSGPASPNVTKSTTVNPNGSWSLPLPQETSGGTFTVTATQYNTAGDTSPASNSVTVTITSTPVLAAPVITSPADGTTTTAATVTFTGTGIPGATVTLLGPTQASTTVASNGSWSTTWTSPQNGLAYTFTATQTDAAGNTSATSNSVTVTAKTPAATSIITSVIQTAQLAIVLAVGSVLKLFGLWN